MRHVIIIISNFNHLQIGGEDAGARKRPWGWPPEKQKE